MDFQNQNAEFEDEAVVQPYRAENEETVAQSYEAENTEAVASPQNMSSEEFSEYIKGINEADPENAVHTHDNTDEDSPEQTDVPYRSFKTQEEFQSFMNKAIGQRLKGSREEMQRYGAIAERARLFYGTTDTAEAVERLMQDLEQQEADSRGITTEELREEQKVQLDAKSWRAHQRAKLEREQVIAEIQERWRRDEQEIRRSVPDFSFQKAMEDERFRELVLKKGMSVSGAYIQLSKNPHSEVSHKKVIHEVGNAAKNAAHGPAESLLDLSAPEFMRQMEKIKNRS